MRKIRVLVGKPGLDGHDRGAKVVAAALRDAGMEVIYTGLHQTPEQIVEAAVQEDVDVVALSILSGAHMTLIPDVQKLMRTRGIGDRLLTGGGIIPPEDMETLARTGVGRLFGPGASTQDIARYIGEWFTETHGGEFELVGTAAGATRVEPRSGASQGRTAAGSRRADPRSRAKKPRKAGAARTNEAAARRRSRAGQATASRRRPAARTRSKRGKRR